MTGRKSSPKKVPRVVALVQARMGSTRLPGKVMKEIMGRPMLSFLIERLERAKTLDQIVIATTDKDAEEPIIELCQRLKVHVFRGSENDVLDRFYKAAVEFKADIIVRLTADNSLIDPQVVDHFVSVFLKDPRSVYLHNGRSYPNGTDVEVFSMKSLTQAWGSATLASEREHVTAYIHKHPELFKMVTLELEEDCSAFRFTVDEAADFQVVTKVLESLYPSNPSFGFKDVVTFLKTHPDIYSVNKGIGWNEGYLKSLKNDKKVSRPGGKDRVDVMFKIFCDKKVGAGHLFRTIELSKVLTKKVGLSVGFICNTNPLARESLAHTGYPFWLYDAKKLRSALPKILVENGFGVLILDQDCDEPGQWITSAAKKAHPGCKILGLDHFDYDNKDVNAIVNLFNQNLKKARPDDKKIQYYEGVEYAIIRGPFKNYHSKAKKISKDGKDVLISFGGADPSDNTLYSFDLLAGLEKKIKVTAILGPLFRHGKMAKAKARKAGWSVMPPVKDMEAHIFRAQIGFSGAGTTCLEFFNLGTPLVIVPQNMHERRFGEYLRSKGLAELLEGGYGQNGKVQARDLCRIETLISDQSRRAKMSKAQKSAVDGDGPMRIGKIIKGLLS
jgi:spore coat polysaccharide biosynthesis protein SpsF